MMSRFFHVLLLGSVLCLAPATQAADVLELVPRDAMGIAVLRNLSQSDAKVARLLKALGTPLPGPLAMLKLIAGVESGLDGTRDLLLVLLPPESNSRQFHLAVWLPTSDYDGLVRSLEGDPERRIAAVTIAGEDLLVVRHGDWAVIMDPDERDRLEQLRDASPSPPRQLAAWSTWVGGHDAAVVVLPTGMRAIWVLAASQKLFETAKKDATADTTDELFGPSRTEAPASDVWSALRESLRELLAFAPEVGNWLAEAEGAACGLRLDAAGDAVVDVRLACAHDTLPPASDGASSVATRPAPRLYEGGEFVVTGSGQVSPRWVVPAVAPYVRQMTNDLAVHFGNKVDAGEVAKFRTEIEQAVADVNAFSVLTRPGKESEGVFTNNFLALRVKSSPAFLERADRAMQLWNGMLNNPQGAIRLVFKSRPFTVAGRKGTEFSIDMAAAVGGPAIPDVKASMEKLFGPGGEFRLQFVPFDEETVLLAAATEAQVAKAIEVLGGAPKQAADLSELRDAETLLAKQSDWRLYVSPYGYNEWLRRQMDAILGPVIGGPVVREFPASPPIGLTGGVDGNVVWTELALPAKTVRGVGKYLRK